MGTEHFMEQEPSVQSPETLVVCHGKTNWVRKHHEDNNSAHHQVTSHNKESGLTLMSSLMTDEEHGVRKS